MLHLLLKSNLLIFAFAPIFAWSMDFESLLKAAESKSLALKIKSESEKKSRAEYKSAQSLFLPKMGVETRFEDLETDNTQEDSTSSNLFAEWNIFNGFKDRNKALRLKAEAQIAANQKAAFTNSFKDQLEAKYSKALLFQDGVEIYQELIRTNEKYLDSLRLRRNSGKISEADFLEYEFFIAKIKREVINLQSQAKQSLTELENFSGVRPITKLSTNLKPYPIQFKNLDKISQDAHLKLQAAQFQRKASYSGFLPQVDLKATYGDIGIRETEEDPETYIGIHARWELFSGMDSVQTHKLEKANLAIAQAQHEMQLNHVQSQAQELQNRLNETFLRFEAENLNLPKIDKFLQLSLEEYKRGAKNGADLKSAIETVLDSKMSVSKLRYEYFETKAELKMLIRE